MNYNEQLVELMEKTIGEVHSLFTLDKQEAARRFNKDAKDIDRFLLDRADAILTGAKFFIDFNKKNDEESTEEEK